jgi:hypothetical protein
MYVLELDLVKGIYQMIVVLGVFFTCCHSVKNEQTPVLFGVCVFNTVWSLYHPSSFFHTQPMPGTFPQPPHPKKKSALQLRD